MHRKIALMVALACCSPAPAPKPAVERRAPAPSIAAAAPAAHEARAPVLLVLIVDQLASWVFEQRVPSLPARGAFARLVSQGLYAPRLRYEHATTSTAPGHAALFTGLPPRGSGVFANERLDERTDKPISILSDPQSRVVVESALEAQGSSAARLKADTLADALRAQRPDARIIAFSLKDRGAIPAGGRTPDVAVWFDPARRSFVTSSAFAEKLPTFVSARQPELESALSSTWQPLDRAWLEQHAPTPDEQAGEGDFSLGIQFPYDLSKAKQVGMVFRQVPAADRAVIELARAALRELPSDEGHAHPLLIGLSLSALDYSGHVHGPDSWESWELLRELDQQLATFIDELEARFGDRLAILLSADHGTAPLPETAGSARARPWCSAPTPDPYQRPCSKGERLYREDLEQRLRQVARRVLGPGQFVRGVIEPFAYLSAELAQVPPARQSAFEDAAVAELEKHPGIAKVFVSRRLRAPCAADESLEALVCRSLPEGAGELYIVPKPGSFFDPNLVHGHGINHGTPYLYDRTVPLLFQTRKLARRGTRFNEPLRPADFTATAAGWLQIEPPAGASSGRDVAKL